MVAEQPQPTHRERQAAATEATFAGGSRALQLADDRLVSYLVQWRLQAAWRRLRRCEPALDERCSVLVVCAGEGVEGSLLADLGFTDVTVSDISRSAMDVAVGRDPRLSTEVLNAEDTGLDARFFDIVVVHDGLHHLQSPVRGFTEMLRLADKAVILLEPHDSWSGRKFGQRWETNGDAVNFVFRWDRRLVDQVAASYLGSDGFENASFAFWHHNVRMEQLARRLGPRAGLATVKVVKTVLDRAVGRFGNQFCGLVVVGDRGRRLHP